MGNHHIPESYVSLTIDRPAVVGSHDMTTRDGHAAECERSTGTDMEHAVVTVAVDDGFAAAVSDDRDVCRDIEVTRSNAHETISTFSCRL